MVLVYDWFLNLHNRAKNLRICIFTITFPLDIFYTPHFFTFSNVNFGLKCACRIGRLKYKISTIGTDCKIKRATRTYLAISFSVCLDVYKIGEAMRILPCSHRFHKACIDQWLLDKRTCPMCKMDILKHYGLIGDSDMMNFEERDESLLNLT